MRNLIMTLLTLFLPFAATAESIASGTFAQESYFTKFEGDWTITAADGETRIVFADNFNTKKAPDLKVFLSRRAFTEVTGKNAANEADAVLIAPLSSYKGQMSFVVPEGINLDDFQSLIVHCEAYAKLWGGSPLRQ